jgi:predicted MFS family arabinose efflux permease
LGNATLDKEDDDDKTTLYILAGIYLGCALVAAAIIFTLLDPLKRYGEKKREGTPTQLIMATAKQMTNPYQILLIPLTIWSGMEQGFWGADFTAGFVTCSSGIANVGFVMICYGVADAISSISFGPVIKYLGRLPVFILGAVINLAVIITLFQWLPNSDEMWVLYVLAALWGIADGIWQCEINAFYGILFPNNEEAAFSNYRLWESLGFVIAYVNTNYLCIDAKLYLLLAILILGMLGYFVIEVFERRKKGKSVE